MRSFLNLKLLSFAPGLDDGLVKHVSVWPAPSVPRPGDSNLLGFRGQPRLHHAQAAPRAMDWRCPARR